MSRLSRRGLLAGATVGGAALAGTAYGIGSHWLRASLPTAVDDPLTGVPATQLQIIAHPDDDLYFFNPELAHALENGGRMITVCLTGGEADGKNISDHDPGRDAAPVRYQEYVAARYAGLRGAYARGAVGDPNSPWRREPLLTADGVVAEMCTLEAAPHVQIAFLNMWQDGERSPGKQKARLRWMWTGETAEQPAMTPVGSSVTSTGAYTRDGLVRTLTGLLERFDPTLVRTMDPDPDHQVHDDKNPRYSDYGDFSDHVDHTPAGLFAWAALQEWWRRGGGRNTVVESYRGYFNRRWPVNLTPDATRHKIDYLAVYGWGDDRDCGEPAGCGDRKVGRPTSLTGYGQGTNHRYAVGSTWLCRGADGRLAAFAVRGGRAVYAGETRAGSGEWLAATVVPGDGKLLPYLTAAQTPDGCWHLFGVRMTLAATDAAQHRDLVTAVQSEPGGAFGDWTVLGNPNEGVPVKRRGIGMPVVAANADGRLQVFVRNFGTGVSTRAQEGAGGGWGPWTDLRGSQTQDGLAAATVADGRIHLFASAKNGIQHWYQKEPNGEFRRDRLDVPPPAGPPAVVRASDGRLRILVRQGETSAVVAYEQVSGGWNTTARHLGGHGGFGPVAATACGDELIAVVQRNDHGTTSLTLRYADELAEGSWKHTGPLLVHAPAVATDESGRLVVAAICADGQLRIARQHQPGAGTELDGWRVAGA